MIKKYYKKISFIIIIGLLALMILWLYLADFGKGKQMEYGVTFSQKYADELELDWQEVFIYILDDLGVKKVRLVAYWDILEPKQGIYSFTDLDWQINEVTKRGGEVILAIGHRVPRWPECHWPTWIYKLNRAERQQEVKEVLKRTVNHFKANKTITAWQVENEPFLRVFGECPIPDNDFYEAEINLVRSLDSRQIHVTESGELSTWLRGGFLGDQVGTSVYRITWNKWFGYFYYPLPPAYYYLKNKIVKLITGVEEIFVSELQMEPWTPMPILQTSFEDQYHSMNAEIFKNNLEYVNRTGLSPVYLWGVEWWYWLKEEGNNSVWEAARKIWRD